VKPSLAGDLREVDRRTQTLEQLAQLGARIRVGLGEGDGRVAVEAGEDRGDALSRWAGGSRPAVTRLSRKVASASRGSGRDCPRRRRPRWAVIARLARLQLGGALGEGGVVAFAA
jgi:hypothetical protein